MLTRTLLATTLATTLATALVAVANAQAAMPLEEAHHAYYHEQYARSLALYETLAATGDAEAAERAGFMLLHGSGLFGGGVARDRERARTLLVQAARADRTGARFLLNMLERTD